MKRTEELWDRIALSYGDGAAVGRSLSEIDARVEDLLNTLRVGSGAYTLDLCCGNGLLTNILAGSGSTVMGIDLSYEMLKKGNNAAERFGLKTVRFLQGGAARLPFADDTFDASCCLSSFQLFPSSEYARDVLRELVRVTKPTGRILIGDVPWKGTLGCMIWDLIRARGGGEAESYVPFQDLHLYKKIWERFRLIFRRFTGRRVGSDDWLWYDRDFFLGCKGTKFEHVHVKLSSQKRFIKYQFDTVISN